MDSARLCSRSSIWRTSTPMSESRPRSESELSGLTVAKSWMPGWGGGGEVAQLATREGPWVGIVPW